MKLPQPTPLAVTILTSDDSAPDHILGKRLMLAMEAGCKGVVCAAADLHEVRQLAPRMRTVVPGIRLSSVPADDQARAATPGDAIRSGADLLVIGRPVTQSTDPVATLQRIVQEISA